MTLFYAGNYAMATTAAATAVTTGTSIKTMLQVHAASTRPIKVVKWGISTTSTPTAAITCELIHTGTVAATVTAHVAAGVQPYNVTSGTPVSSVQLGTSNTGFTSSAEGTVTASRYADLQVIPAGVSQMTWEWSLGREFELPPSGILRVRVTTATAVNMLTYVIWDE